MKYCNNGKYDFMLQKVEQLELLFKMRVVTNFCNKKRKFKFDGLAVLPEFRKNGYGDFIMHMIFDKAYQSGAHYLVSNDIYHMPDYFKKYGFSIENNHLSLDLKQYFNTHKCCH